MKKTPCIPPLVEDVIPEFIKDLYDLIQEQTAIIKKQAEQIQLLKDEIARLKNQPPRPKIRPSRLSKGKKLKKSTGKRAGSKKRSKTSQLVVHDVKPVEPEYLPDGSVFKYYKKYMTQDIKIEPFNTLYKIKVYETPDGKLISGKPPEHLNGTHFGDHLTCFILYQYHHCHVTQPLLLDQLRELGIDISSGQLSRIITRGKNGFHQEKDRILAAGLEVSKYINVDDTGARHDGQNGYCTHIGNDWFSWFQSTRSKSRINFLQLLTAGHSDYYLNVDAIGYMQSNNLPKYVLDKLTADLGKMFANDSQWNDYLAQTGIARPQHIRIATEGALIGSYFEHDISDNLIIVSDDAGQFNILLHALCWVHAERTIDKVIPFTDEIKTEIDNVKDQIWTLYEGLKRFKQNPRPQDKKRLKEMFDSVFTTQTSCVMLNEALKRIYRNKSELLLVLDHPEIPLHNNTAERALRDYVKKRKISGSTRSESGRSCRDTFASLKKTCKKLNVPFWHYLKDRIGHTDLVPDLSELIRNRALDPG